MKMWGRDVNQVLDAVLRRDLQLLRKVVERGANVDIRDRDQRTPLGQAVTDNNLEIVRFLVEHGADVNARDAEGWTTLHFAAQEHHVEIASLLLERGAQVDAKDVFGSTPLWRAVYASKGRGELIRCLLSYGADRHLKNNHGVSPLDLARSIGNYPVAKFLNT